MSWRGKFRTYPYFGLEKIQFKSGSPSMKKRSSTAANTLQLFNVFLVRTPGFSESKFEDVLKLLTSLKGPLVFKAAEKPALEHGNDESFFPKPWSYFFDLANEFRDQNDIGDDEFVVILSEKSNKLNWFSAADYGGSKNLFVHTGDWDLIFGEGDESYPIAYHVAITLLHFLWFESIDEINFSNVHQAPIGCINDFCEEKNQAILKMRTADICPVCIAKIVQRGIQMPVIIQVISILEKIRKGMLFKELLQRMDTIPVLTVIKNNKFLFEDLNVEIDFSKVGKVGKAVYLFFLNRVEGASYYSLQRENFRELFDQYMSQISPDWNKKSDLQKKESENNEDVKAKKATLTHNLQENLSTLVNRINKAFELELGPALAKSFSITGPTNGVRKIEVNRSFVKFKK
mgnify:CR=1 FL=1